MTFYEKDVKQDVVSWHVRICICKQHLESIQRRVLNCGSTLKHDAVFAQIGEMFSLSQIQHLNASKINLSMHPRRIRTC